jgi:hypothetical protein
MPWRMQLKAPSTGGKWVDIKPSGANSAPYEYATEEEAAHMLRTCYPEVVRGFFDNCEARVKEFPE